MTGPQSRSPIIETLIGSGRVSSSATPMSPSAARNLPTTRSEVRTGSVMSTSRVPIFCSSLHWRIVTAETSSTSRIGSDSNIGRTSARLRAKNFDPVKNWKHVAARKTPRKMSATGDRKNARSSLRAVTRMPFTLHLASPARRGRCAGP